MIHHLAFTITDMPSTTVFHPCYNLLILSLKNNAYGQGPNSSQTTAEIQSMIPLRLHRINLQMAQSTLRYLMMYALLSKHLNITLMFVCLPQWEYYFIL